MSNNAVIPEQLLPYWDDHAQAGYDKLAATSYDQIVDYVNDHPAVYPGYSGSRFVDCRPAADHDTNRVIAMGFPYTNGWKPHMAIRILAMQAVLPEPMRIIGFPDNAPTQTAYVLYDREKETVSRGQFDPIAQRRLTTLSQLGVENVNFIDYSLSAAVGAAGIKLALQQSSFEVGPSGLFEPPNVLNRSVGFLGRGGLEAAFFATGAADLNKAIKDSAIPALDQAQSVGNRLDLAKQTANILASYIFSRIDKTARAVKKGMATDTFIDDVDAIRQHENAPDLLIVGGSLSTIFPIEVQSKLGALTLEGEKHTMGDDVRKHGLMARAAIFGY